MSLDIGASGAQLPGALIVPVSLKSSSAPLCVGRQVVLRPKLEHPVPNAFPWLRHAAPWFEVTARLFQNHCPAGVKFWFAWTAIQYVPDGSETTGASVIAKSPVVFVKAMADLVATTAPGRFELFA